MVACAPPPSPTATPAPFRIGTVFGTPALASDPTGTTAAATGAAALAGLLFDDFQFPFDVYDAQSGRPLLPARTDRPDTLEILSPAAATYRAEHGLTGIVLRADGWYEITAAVPGCCPPLFVRGIVRGVAGPGGDAAREQAGLERLLRSVVERFRLREENDNLRRKADDQAAQAARAWGAVVEVDEAARHLRPHRDGDRVPNGLLQMAVRLADAEAVCWVPESGTPTVYGALAVDPFECATLADVLTREALGRRAIEPIVMNRDRSPAWAARLPQVRSVLAVPVGDSTRVGWLIGLNKRVADPARGQAAGFRRSDALAMLPAAGLFGLHLRVGHRFRELKELLVGLTRSLTAAIDAKDAYTFGHSERVARVAVELGREAGLGADELGDVYLAGLLHDVGKIGIRDAVLLKEGPLTPDEFAHIKQHPVIGHQILSGLRPLRALLPGVRSHHERWDGGGYPDRTAGADTPLLARLLAVADGFDAMSTRRTYRDALPPAEVDRRLRAGAGTQWDPAVVDAFFRCRDRIAAVRERGVGNSLVVALDGALRSVESFDLPMSGGAGSRERLQPVEHRTPAAGQ